MLKNNGNVIINMKYIQPSSVPLGIKPKKTEELLQILRSKGKVHEVDGIGIAEKLGNLLVVTLFFLESYLLFQNSQSSGKLSNKLQRVGLKKNTLI